MKRIDDEQGVRVEGELYELDLDHLERLLAGEPLGLGLGVVELQGGERELGILWVKGALPPQATDISRFGGWRGYRKECS